MSYVSTRCYQLAKAHHTIMVCLAQMNRDYNSEADRADAGWIRSSSRIVHDATGVLMFTWPKKRKEAKKDEKGLVERDNHGRPKYIEHEIGDDVKKRPIKAFQIKRRNNWRKMVAMHFWGECRKFEPDVAAEHRGRPKGSKDKVPRAKKKTQSVYDKQIAEMAMEAEQYTKYEDEEGGQWTKV